MRAGTTMAKGTHHLSQTLDNPMRLAMTDALPCDARVGTGLDIGKVDDIATTKGMHSCRGGHG